MLKMRYFFLSILTIGISLAADAANAAEIAASALGAGNAKFGAGLGAGIVVIGAGLVCTDLMKQTMQCMTVI